MKKSWIDFNITMSPLTIFVSIALIVNFLVMCINYEYYPIHIFITGGFTMLVVWSVWGLLIEMASNIYSLPMNIVNIRRISERKDPIVFGDIAWICSECGNVNKKDAEYCVHCQRQKVPRDETNL